MVFLYIYWQDVILASGTSLGSPLSKLCAIVSDISRSFCLGKQQRLTTRVTSSEVSMFCSWQWNRPFNVNSLWLTVNSRVFLISFLFSLCVWRTPMPSHARLFFSDSFQRFIRECSDEQSSLWHLLPLVNFLSLILLGRAGVMFDVRRHTISVLCW